MIIGRPDDAPEKTAEPCRDPRFTWLGPYWSPCQSCGRLAWDHEQADPLQDVRNYLEQISRGLDGSHFPPTMRELPQ